MFARALGAEACAARKGAECAVRFLNVKGALGIVHIRRDRGTRQED